MPEKSGTRDYMDKKLRLLYIQVGCDLVKAVCLILLVVWMFLYPDVVRDIFR